MSETSQENKNPVPTSKEEATEKFNLVREMIKHEDELINARISWFTTSQGLLFATLGVTGDIKNNEGIVIILSFLGISTSMSTFESLRLANVTRKELREWLKSWRRNHVIKVKDTGKTIELKDFFPPLPDFSSNKNEEPTTQLIKRFGVAELRDEQISGSQAGYSSLKILHPVNQQRQRFLRNLGWAIRPWRSFPILFGMTWILLLVYIFAYK